ncbi:hypothetical protein SAMN05216352_102326 [Alteribacillus bidgolensis]|uniref:Uncharacterized protein n=1 Tax=Alteribacillus bidgolensis TaxID=930129 RepID=A0A1G8EPL8_9BACI|nr:hypothetical protein SAMN05216352_102326 [Alteribacillus bidgolensis]
MVLLGIRELAVGGSWTKAAMNSPFSCKGEKRVPFAVHPRYGYEERACFSKSMSIRVVPRELIWIRKPLVPNETC